LPDHAGSPERWEPAAFSADTDWMPNAVLLAKSIHVWLGQLSRSYGCRINTLDQIPDDALDRLAGWGFNALWLIGIWERSGASRKIKQMHGNPEAEASAYALYSYRVAADLGGEPALDNLEARCASRGIRLACDVVPNHTGIDSEWIQQHPDWFVQCDTPPYPAYSFKGTDLCDNPGISIHIEEGYWDHSDAAVVFEHFDHHSGRHRYIYHGNDGTHMPWNDTAQLNFLLPEVRQAMSDLILETAKRFRLIRFDAAMTLARKHFRRLWFPPPGGSAGVSSRSAFWMEDADFDKAFPREFWRDVVDRVNREAPNTLLIAEAFWLMESYFVRNLGMHRVYNSAFMNLLKREENAKYRRILKDVLAYNPGILKRYVNFMNNPDEATAVEQFDKGDKYFGTAVLLATLPGLPMFGHGQIEGFREKYGMEFRRAYWNEEPDTGFITHHEAQIFPLLRRRYLFSDVAQFALYDFEASDGVDENVFAFSNGTDTERCLVVYNNSPSPTRGKLCTSVPKAPPDSEGQAMPGKPLIEELGLTASNAAFCRFRNHRDNRESLRSLAEMYEGLEITLGPYQYDVYYDFRLLDDASGAWRKLCDHLGGQPVASLDEAILGFRHYELWAATQHLFSPDRLQTLAENLTSFPLSDAVLTILDTMNADLDKLAKQLAATLGRSEPKRSGSALRIRFGKLARQLEKGKSQAATSSGLEALWNSSLHRGLVYPLFCWQVCDELIARVYTDHDPVQLITDFKRFGLTMAWRETLPAAQRQRDPALVELLLLTAKSCPHPAESRPAFEALFTRPEMHGLLGINQHEGETWFDQDRMEDLCCALVLQRLCLPTGSDIVLAKDIERYKCRIEHAAASGYRLDKFLNLT
jgi:glycosidase